MGDATGKLMKELISALRAYSDELKVCDVHYSHLFTQTADNIGRENDKYFMEFYKYLIHYKGLIDEEPCGMRRSKWIGIVTELRRIAIAIVNNLNREKMRS
jgi:hypothetical protein